LIAYSPFLRGIHDRLFCVYSVLTTGEMSGEMFPNPPHDLRAPTQLRVKTTGDLSAATAVAVASSLAVDTKAVAVSSLAAAIRAAMEVLLTEVALTAAVVTVLTLEFTPMLMQLDATQDSALTEPRSDPMAAVVALVAVLRTVAAIISMLSMTVGAN
jgi:hypothetical protein